MEAVRFTFALLIFARINVSAAGANCIPGQFKKEVEPIFTGTQIQTGDKPIIFEAGGWAPLKYASYYHCGDVASSDRPCEPVVTQTYTIGLYLRESEAGANVFIPPHSWLRFVEYAKGDQNTRFFVTENGGLVYIRDADLNEKKLYQLSLTGTIKKICRAPRQPL